MQIDRAEPGDTKALADWREVHNVIIPADPLSQADVRERAGRNVLSVAYVNGELVGCSTVRMPEGEERAVVVIARILPEFRRRGFGTALFQHCMEQAAELDPGVIETIVLSANKEGYEFAIGRGFVEVERGIPEGLEDEFVSLQLPVS
ncbi:hypothetical protein Afil01_24110 [Actinorhabdospora filicis]|uniref:N-acetyltransferase domain-containing protein n=2 Tax=Actinorhabdospora filicis TaxID=1785913 RepID=A0A9W6SKZ8_9ACTN|nr:hypothetical protein Afil01_24110 [Actinorhabdospora filicis]